MKKRAHKILVFSMRQAIKIRVYLDEKADFPIQQAPFHQDSLHDHQFFIGSFSSDEP